MAKLKHGILGPISGKLGPVVGATWMGIPYLRQEAKKKENPGPRSKAQIANEQKMIFVNKVLMPFHPYVMVGFQNLAIQKTALSAAYSANFHRAINGVYPNLEVDYSKMMTSKGHFPGLTDPEMKLITPEKLEINWQNTSHSAAAYDDQLMLTVYSPELHLTDGFIGGIKRAAKTTVFTLDPLLIGKSLEVYISVMSANRKKIADSVYLGRITS